MAAEQKSTTRRRLELALRRLQHGKMQSSSDARISIAAVAREAGVSNATVHNRYPDIAERVRRLHAKASRLSTKAMPDTVDILHRKLREAHKEIDQLKTDLARSQSINLRLTREHELLHARLLKQKSDQH
ncbi:TetR family transcriptional regulator [Burkholderia sp. JPY481]